MSVSQSTVMFPATESFLERSGLRSNAKGNLAARIPRIFGQGRTRAEGLDLPPATIERQQELLALALPEEAAADVEVQREIQDARRAVDAHAEHMRHGENQRRFALEVLQRLQGVATGAKDNQFFAGRLVLVPDKAGQNWSWSLTRHYAVIAKIPADIDYVSKSYAASEQIVVAWTLEREQFLNRLTLAWLMARHFSPSDNVYIADVARFFKVAVQEERFWGNPSRRYFEDVPEAVFIANLIEWRRTSATTGAQELFELQPATLNQAHGPKSRAFYVPTNAEGTADRPMIYIRRK